MVLPRIVITKLESVMVIAALESFELDRNWRGQIRRAGSCGT